MIKLPMHLMLILTARRALRFRRRPRRPLHRHDPRSNPRLRKRCQAKNQNLDRIQAMEMTADLALIPPRMNTSPLPEYGYDRLDYGMTIGIERTPAGRLWACWVTCGDSCQGRKSFVLATSDDDVAMPVRLTST